MDSTAPLSAAWRTDPGRVRSHNEDFVAAYEPDTPDNRRLHGSLYIVADGVGGADAGEVASQYASERTLHHYLAAAAQESWGLRLVEAMQSANTDLRRLAADRDASRRMATTMVAAVIQDGQAYVANVGDSRAYRWRGGGLEQVTRDQSLVARLVEEGALTAEEAIRYPYKNVILYSIGSEKRPPIDLYEVALEPGDLLLLCSDGLTRHVEDGEIAAELGRGLPATAAETLVQLARERGGEDNITVAIVRHGLPAEIAPAPPAFVDDQPTLTVARPRPLPATPARVAAPAVEARPRLWSLVFALAAVMMILIFVLWIFIQGTLTI